MALEIQVRGADKVNCLFIALFSQQVTALRNLSFTSDSIVTLLMWKHLNDHAGVTKFVSTLQRIKISIKSEV